MRDFRHETVFERSETEGAFRRRSWHAEEGSCASFRRVGTDHKALPEATSGDRRRRAQAGAGPSRPQGRSTVEEALPAQVRLNPDLTLAEHCELFEDVHGVKVSTSTMSRAFEKLGLSLKKSPSLRPSETKKGGSAGANR